MSAPSAKPLFQATKRKNQGDPRQSGLGDFPEKAAPKGQAHPVERRENDFYPTAGPEAVRALFAKDGARIHKLGCVWEPAVGEGHIARVIEEQGVPVVASDMVDRGWPGTEVKSFYEYREAPARAIITNPPFSEISARNGKGAWLRHTMDLPGWDYLALLLSAEWHFGKVNGFDALLEQHPISYVYAMRWKLDFTGQGNPAQRNCWYVWDKHWCGGETALRWMDRVDPRQGALL